MHQTELEDQVTCRHQQIIRLLQANLFDGKERIPLLRGDPMNPHIVDHQQTSLV